MIVLGLDPGNVYSAIVLLDTENQEILYKGIHSNRDCLLAIEQMKPAPHICIIEQIASYGMAVGETVFETAVWSGRFLQYLDSLGLKYDRIKRNEIKNILCGSSRAKDSNIRQRLIDMFGQVGTKKNPGMLYGMKADMWAALAVAVAWDIKQKEKK